MADVHQSVNWGEYFRSIRHECPWSHAAYQQGLIDIVYYDGLIWELGHYHARVYIVNAPNLSVEALAKSLDYGQDEWLFSYPEYGKFATPVPILIQQDRAKLRRLREKQNASS